MSIQLPEDLAWSHDPSLSEEQRWHAFKAWEAKKRVEFAKSSRGQAEYKAWLALEPENDMVRVRHQNHTKPKVYRIY